MYRTSRREPRLKPSAQVHHDLNPIFKQILKIAERTGNPSYFRKDLVIDKLQITRHHPEAVLFGIRDSGTDLICLSRGKRKSVSQRTSQSMWFGGYRLGWYEIAKGHIEYPNGNNWYLVTRNADRRVTKEEALTIVEKYHANGTVFSSF